MARDQVWKELRTGMPGDQAGLPLLDASASDWRNARQYFSAAYAMMRAMGCAWGYPERMIAYARAALQDFQYCVEKAPASSLESLAALLKWSALLSRLNSYFPMEGWFEEQKRAYGRNFQFMHLDGIVNWIIRERLVNEFRAVVNELNMLPKLSRSTGAARLMPRPMDGPCKRRAA